MKRLLPLFALLASGCGKSGPVATDAGEPPANVTGDGPVTAGAAEAADRAALPLPTDGMVWRGEGGTLRFGALGGPPQLSVRCEGGRMVMARHAAAPDGGKGTLSFTGGGEASSMPAMAAPDPLAPGGRGWRGVAEGDVMNDVARTFERPGPVEITLGGAPNLVVPGSAALSARLRCGG